MSDDQPPEAQTVNNFQAPDNLYANFGMRAETLEQVARMCAVMMASEMTTVTKESLIEVSDQIASFVLTGERPKKPRIVKNDPGA